ncbi:MAG TPA: hypothetical protein VF605_11705 [Allosphingosinicella sp.]|jgi:hypothetical protein
MTDTPLSTKPLSKQTKPELLETAAGLEIEVPADATNPAIIALIEAALEARKQTTQEEPTRPRPVDQATGRQLDAFGLPLSGPARIRALTERGKKDPLTHPEDWTDSAGEPAGGAE